MKKNKTRKYAGMTLVEMIVAIGILSFILIGVSLLFVRIWPLQRFATDSSRAQLGATRSVTGLVNLIRNMRQSDAGEYALQRAESDEIIFFADQDRDGAVERVRFFRSETDLKMGIIRPTGSPVSYPTNQEVITVFSTQVRNGSGSYPAAIFHFFDDKNEELVENFSVNNVRMVEVDMYIDINPSFSPEAAHFESFASIRNLSEYDHL